MTFRLAYPFDPDDLEAEQPPFVQDLIRLREWGYHEVTREVIKMVSALKELGSECHFLEKLKGSPLLELKSHSRGGNKGGTRVYLFQGAAQTFFLCRAEWKQGDSPDPILLEDTAYILLAYQRGQPLFPEWMQNKPAQYKDNHDPDSKKP